MNEFDVSGMTPSGIVADSSQQFQPGGMSPGAQATISSGFRTPTGELNWDLISSMLGRGAQAFSAQDPTSWQHQVGGLGAGLAESSLKGKAATKAAGEKSDLMTALKMLSGQTPNAKGLPGVSSWSTDANGEISMKVTPERAGLGFDIGGLRGAGVEPPEAAGVLGGQGGQLAPMPAAAPTGGAGQPEVFSPFHQALQGG